ncbi:MAG: SulP family inorganic anion transporter [Planctomycetales bacterium]
MSDSKVHPKLDTGFSGFLDNLWADVLSGFLVFLIALPLCLGISLASGFPAIAGVFTAILGGVITPFFSNSALTIKGPAAGMIVVVLGAMMEFGYTGKPGNELADANAYHLTLAVGMAAGIIQIVLGFFRAGFLSDFFPTSVVHGMLAAIGVIIASKQIHVALGVKPESKEIIGQIMEIPKSFMNLNPEIALISIISLTILFGLPALIPVLFKNDWIKKYFFWLKRIPTQMLVVLIAIPLGIYFDLEHEHTYSFAGHQYPISPKMLVDVPMNVFSQIAFPTASAFWTVTGIKWIIVFTLVGSLESLLSAKAIDLIDPLRRKTDYSKDLLAIGIANTVAASVGGLPMISEIVRSKANIDNGAKSRFANFFHGIFLFIAVAAFPFVIHKIPLAALASMLIYTGFRLASPREFVNVKKIGTEQFVIFTSTLIGVLATDLLVGILIGVLVKMAIHYVNGATLYTMFFPDLVIEDQGEGDFLVSIRHTAVFSNWIALKKKLERIDEPRSITVDLSETRLVDHTVMENLHHMQEDFEHAGIPFQVQGLDDHRAFSSHPLATRKKSR